MGKAIPMWRKYSWQFAHTRMKRSLAAINLMIHAGVLSISLLRLSTKFKTYWGMLIPTKATGYDNVPPTIVEMTVEELAAPLTNLKTLSDERSSFPNDIEKTDSFTCFIYRCKANISTFQSIILKPGVITDVKFHVASLLWSHSPELHFSGPFY